MELVAEGIETHDQLDVIRELGINAVQGYLFSKPLPVAVLRTTIREPILAPEPAPGQPAKGQKSAA
jgi:EAL domain-containing protein (putative c-di-GMP-specific phosphodiesterase class I)